MLNDKQKKEALAIHEKAVNKYNAEYQKMEQLGSRLYEKRLDSVSLIKEIEALVSSIANKPKEFEKKILNIRAEQFRFKETEDYVSESMKVMVKAGAGAAAGIAGG